MGRDSTPDRGQDGERIKSGCRCDLPSYVTVSNTTNVRFSRH